VGCDGIRSRVRQLILGVNDPASYPTYTHKYAFRGLVPMSLAQPILGTEKTQTRHMYLGRNGHALTFPVAGGKMLNVVAFTTDSSPWPYPDNFTAPVAKLDVVKAFASFNSTVRAIIDLLPDQLNKWAVFDTYDHPAPTFLKGSVCIAGDAAHAAAPYHGAGAGFAIEDGAVLAQLLDRAGSSIGIDRSRAIHAALETYDAVRRERAQWLVQSSRFVGEMYEWRDETIGDDPGRCVEEIEWRSRKIWDYDVEEMMSQADSAFEARVEALRGGETR
jgi:salicylate hydroxylase